MTVVADRRPYRKPTGADMARARQLHAAGGWGVTAITRMLNEDGVMVSRFAVGRWVDPAKAERHLAQTRQWGRARRATDEDALRMPGARTPEWKLARMRLLSRAGVTPRGIAAVMSVDFPGDPVLSKYQVSYALEKAGETGVSS